MSDIPELIGRFPIIDTLGVGGMGVVYLGKDPDIGRKVAIKVLHSTGDTEALERFKNEARTIGEISHPNIVILLEYGIDNKKPFLVMEYLPGQSLEDWIVEVHTFEKHKRILLDLCSALTLAHGQEILHRDLKPGNIQILPSGQAKLLDFGIATSQDSGLTATGFFIGTPKYLAPEILQDTTHTKSSDCYSLALLAYTMLSGKNPFSADNFEATMTRLLTKIPVSLHKLNPNIPIDLSKAIDCYLEKNPQKRPNTPEKLKLALELITKPHALKKTIVHSSQSDEFNAQETTVLLGQTQKSNKKTGAITIIVIVFVLLGFLSNKYLRGDKTNASVTKTTLAKEYNLEKTKGKIKNNKPIKKDLTQAVKSEEGEDQKTTNETPILEEQNSVKIPVIDGADSKKPYDMITTQKKIQQPDILLVDKKKVEVVKKKGGEVKSHTADRKQTKKVKKSKKASNKDNSQKIAKVQNQKKDKTNLVKESKLQPKVAVQESVKRIDLPVFQLPTLSSSTRKIRLKTDSDTKIARGKTKSIRIKNTGNIVIDNYIIMRGLSLFDQVEIRKIRKLDNNQTEITLYAQSNSQLGVFSLFGVYKNKKTKSLNLEVTL